MNEIRQTYTNELFDDWPHFWSALESAGLGQEPLDGWAVQSFINGVMMSHGRGYLEDDDYTVELFNAIDSIFRGFYG